MNKSSSINLLSKALSAAQAELKNPHFDAMNPHFKSKFASLAAVRESVIPTFCKHGLALSQWPVSENGFAGCMTHLAHASGEWMESVFLIPVDKHNAHGYASAVTYAKRIAMQSVAGVVGEEDDDANAAVGENVKGERAVQADIRNSATQGAWEAMDTDMQTFLTDIAANAKTLLGRGKNQDAWDEIESHGLEQEALLALWTRLDSKERSALKKIGPFTPKFGPDERKAA